jgi:osmotically-inducible protein OsmY
MRSSHNKFPGVSGKDRDEGQWFNESQYQLQKNFTGKGPKGYFREDARIHEEVCEILYHHPLVNSSDIEVEVKDAVVYLRGTVGSRQQKRQAERSLDFIWGIVDVVNQLKVT